LQNEPGERATGISRDSEKRREEDGLIATIITPSSLYSSYYIIFIITLLIIIILSHDLDRAYINSRFVLIYSPAVTTSYLAGYSSDTHVENACLIITTVYK
jgi:hypothetical protein